MSAAFKYPANLPREEVFRGTSANPSLCATLLPMTQVDPTSEHPLIGQTIAGKFKVVRLLGEGGMGCVYQGEQMLGTTARKVAIKTLHKHLSHDESIKARFKREVGTVAALEHPNTIQVFDFGTMEDGTLYIVMEFVQGRSVADVLEKDGAMPPERVLNILRQVVGSLEEAHSHGIVHRDLKPDNVVLSERAGQKDWVEVLDFGIAKRSSEHDPNEAKLTQQGMVLGTPPYMSPEQFTGQPIDVRSDIYALGVMAYEMLTGRLPWEANTAWEWASKHMTEPPTPLDRQPLGPNVPEECATRSRVRSPRTRTSASDRCASSST
jgi:serine/threonine-protein kinase